MAYTQDSKPLELTQLTSLATDDTFIVGDTSDTSEVAKYITKANLLTDFGSTFAALSHTHATSDITSGTFADARIAESNVTQHQAALSITESQISDLGTYLTSASISDTVYGVGWNGDTTTAASKNAIYDKIEALDAAKADTSHTHTHADITDYDTELAGKTNTTAFTPTADYHVATKKYVDDNAGGGDLWSDVVDADIIPDADGTRDLGNTSTRFAETYTDALDVTNNIVVGGTVDGRDIATDGTKLDGIEANADVTDETNVVSSLSGATLTDITVAGTDKVLLQDVSDSDNLRTETAQAIADLKTTEVSEDTTPQAGGAFDLNGNEIGDATEYDNGNSGTSDTVDWGNGNFQKSTLTGNCTFTFTAPSLKGRFQLRLIQDATGSRTVTWPAAVQWPGGTAPTLTTTANAIDIITFFYDGTNYYGLGSLNFS